jgi:hypothetical protein
MTRTPFAWVPWFSIFAIRAAAEPLASTADSSTAVEVLPKSSLETLRHILAGDFVGFTQDTGIEE